MVDTGTDIYVALPLLATYMGHADITSTEYYLRFTEDTLLRIDLPTDSIQLLTGEDRPDGGWVSPRFGEKLPATRLVWRGEVPPGGR